MQVFTFSNIGPFSFSYFIHPHAPHNFLSVCFILFQLYPSDHLFSEFKLSTISLKIFIWVQFMVLSEQIGHNIFLSLSFGLWSRVSTFSFVKPFHLHYSLCLYASCITIPSCWSFWLLHPVTLFWKGKLLPFLRVWKGGSHPWQVFQHKRSSP